MNRLAIASAILLLSLTACIPGLIGDSPADLQKTVAEQVGTFSAMTMAALPSSTLRSMPTQTLEQPPIQRASTGTAPAASETSASLSETPPATHTSTSALSATVTPSLTATIASGSATATDLMVTRQYGTQPPAIDYGRVKLVNQSSTQVYISFQCTTADGIHSIVESPVGKITTISVPAGRCFYVAWVGGVQFTGEFGLNRSEEKTFTFKHDKIIIH